MQKQDLQTAQTMAQDWVNHKTDPNEIAKALRYLRDYKSGPLFFRYLRTVVDEGRAVVRSGRTLDYYRQILDTCERHLAPYRDDPETMAQILGWAVRLMRYYRAEPKLPRPPKVAPTRRKPKKKPKAERRQGRIKWFDPGKGYGFIKEQDSEEEWFVHHSQLPDALKAPAEGTPVSFVIGQGPKGRDQAQDVQPVV
jgi:cold shock CspA family protein